MTSLTVILPDVVAEWIGSLISAGRYASIGEYVTDLIERDREGDARRLSELDPSIIGGLADIEAGRVHDAETVFDEMEAKFSAMVAAGGGPVE